MGTAFENINKTASKEPSDWLEEARARQAGKDWRNRSFKIAVRILREIRAQKAINGMTQKKLAEAMNVSPQYINKVVKGKENLTLETIAKIEQVLGITLLDVPVAETAQTFVLERGQSQYAISRNLSISISEEECPYNKNVYSDATGTYG